MGPGTLDTQLFAWTPSVGDATDKPWDVKAFLPNSSDKGISYQATSYRCSLQLHKLDWILPQIQPKSTLHEGAKIQSGLLQVPAPDVPSTIEMILNAIVMTAASGNAIKPNPPDDVVGKKYGCLGSQSDNHPLTALCRSRNHARKPRFSPWWLDRLL